jgi:DNA (cytosine-5)-methyltransferase 1
MKHLGDITKINGAEIEAVDVITGGSLCQDLSIGGKRAGLAGARSGLFMEQVRIVKEMREHDRKSGRTGDMVRPRFMVWENVPGAFSSNKGRDFAAVLEEIIRIAEPEAPDIEVPEKGWPTWGGYHDEVGGRWSVAWRVHDAQHWGVPQRRRRISVVADFGGDTAGEILFERKSVPGHPAESGTARERLAEAAERGFNPAVGDCMTAWDCQSKLIFDTNGKSPTLQGGVGGGVNNPAIFAAIPINDKATRWQVGGESRNHDGSGNGLGIGKEGDPSPTLTAGDRHGVMCLTPWEAQSARVYDQDGVWHSLNANENGGMARDSVMCAGFKLGNSEQARSIGYAEEQSPTLNAECGGNKPAVMCLNDQGGNVMGVSHDVSGTLRAQEHGHQPAVIAFAQNQREEVRNVGDKAVSLAAEVGMHCQTFVALDMSHACDVIRDCGEVSPSLQARMGTGCNQIPLTYQMQGFGDYREGDVASSCKQRDFKDSTDLVCAVDCRNFCEGGETNGTLQSKSNGGISYNLQNTVRTGMIVRRLTPMECERLQGFPDGWTDIGEWMDSKGKRHKAADSPRYKALGNSIALPFWDFLAKRISAQYLRPVTMGSLFDGIGGFPLVFERHNGKGTARWASEIEEFPIAVTKKWFGEE